MFGFAIYNTKDKSLFIARDFFGIKPMHYAVIGKDLVYGSEIKSILKHPKYLLTVCVWVSTVSPSASLLTVQCLVSAMVCSKS